MAHFWLSFHFSRCQNWKSPSSVFLCPETEQKRLLRLLRRLRRRRLRKRHLKSDLALLQICSRLFHLVQYVKFWQIFLALNSKRLYVSKFRKVKESCCLVLTSSKKHEIRHFHVVVVQRMYKKVWCTCKVVVLPLPFCRCLFSTSLTLLKGAVSRQSSSFCLILSISRPQSLWNLK